MTSSRRSGRLLLALAGALGCCQLFLALSFVPGPQASPAPWS
eukprot:CAMPEP_0115664020 /NCGR_PEP_ID=MMETSP0272-20121206/48152_1 /TAXON_ID=71861 /ORGANISM="Scrippsiella trochoidea, Strain CCMP3099" /LENGTH=41 /DNA_ID= /DNA_START= /DNA_END= /DNA_ORIENTATION=